MANNGDLEDAERIFNELIIEPSGNNADDAKAVVSVAAEYNLANAYLREALKIDEKTSSKTLPLVELAKQRYRNLLHYSPQHWNARYNLERALIMAPEVSNLRDGERADPVKSVNVIVPGFEKQDLP